MADAPAYVPQSPIPLGDEDARAVMEWTYKELLRLSRALMTMKALDLQPTYTAPTRPREGMIVHADGTQWNPGSGAGTYAYIGGAWVKLGSTTVYAPASADYLVKTANGTLTAERVVMDTTSEVWDWSTAGQAAVNYIATPTNPTLALTLAASSCLIAVRKYVPPTGAKISLGLNAILKVM